MQTWKGLAACGAAFTAAMAPVATAGIAIAGAEAGTIVVLDSKLRRCDFSLISTVPMVPRSALGTGEVIIHSTGGKASAEVHLSDAPEPGTHFDVGLIQEPRPAAGGCGPGSTGTAYSGLDTDGAGGGMTTVSDTIRQGTTGVWVIISRPNPNSQNPAEFYTSEFVAPV
ncbi:hypothetical protein [Mycobacterium montefiorense]|uniref:Secreted protein n=1 Tax=Mycobacterium montefiorense TaxID=154654 RepID=A0AA37UW56_9MYCO|nr:hypothetical protein [Mycobacterium montefiorense]GBG40872.1 hypothetical protein MmonteBS_52440 [Mycobacterium montefiorense]GKU33487.1 hypothetical protein NJB14191_08340 [Mycobacterium montefiorense]GKU39982.1 hypothetical protein NJB14192_19710 [Mycobacterium montefiorense]GKU45318.1 hypothetical protein NJB14194_19410 [Mycobacterium montefiorense]GKU49377.1 hypothetical protein NJB14195_06240 [Mycobacterium montefiorense]